MLDFSGSIMLCQDDRTWLCVTTYAEAPVRETSDSVNGLRKAGPRRAPCVESLFFTRYSTTGVAVDDRGGGRGESKVQWTTPRKMGVRPRTGSGDRVRCKWPPRRTTASMTTAPEPATSWWARWRCTGAGPGYYTARCSRSWRCCTPAGCTCG